MHTKGGSKVSMPLKIESGTYTVNRTAKKSAGSKFLLWKNWRRSVHEDRGDESRGGRAKAGRSEVAGSGDNEDDSLTVTLVPDCGATDRASRRTRPLSLAVQPLNYQRLDPERHSKVNVKHPNMTSQESIGSCSLDIEQSASDRSEATRRSLSEKTLHSLNLSCNGDADKLKNGNSEITRHGTSPHEKVTVSNGHHDANESEQLVTKKPSYLGLACSISGYSGITRYDSKLREGFRSRDSSPGARLVTRDTSPAGFRSSENLEIPSSHSPKSQSISPLAMDRQNGFTNGLRESRRIESYSVTKNYTDVVDRGCPPQNQTRLPEFSPIRSVMHSPAKGSIFNSHEDSFSSTISQSSPKSMSFNASNSITETNVSNGSMNNSELSTGSSQKSFIQQRVERLYGPGALAQGFFFKRSTVNKSITSDKSLNNSNNSHNSSLDSKNVEESLKNLPVFRHLRPEFRAQLPVVSQRRPTDGSEQVIKPLQRLSLSSKKEQAKETAKISPPSKKDTPTSKSNKMGTCITNHTDQQPAAPKVVLPVIETVASPSNAAKRIKEAEIIKEEDKDGHYFMKMLERERSRLLFLAESVENELANSALPEEAAGKLRSAAGKARLLATQKMHQFMGLCQKNINQVPGEEFPTTNEDLAGFWDMVMLQVVQVNNLFDQIELLRSSHWQEITTDVKSTTPSRSNSNAASKRRIPTTKPKIATNSEVTRKANEAREQLRRQMLEERRRAMRNQNAKNTTDSVEIFVPET